VDALVVKFGHNVARARDLAGITQEGLSELCGIHPTEISRIENGRRDVKITTVARLSQALGTTPGALMDGRFI
jgi:transcriptional regulator with XRE-family HTH domain